MRALQTSLIKSGRFRHGNDHFCLSLLKRNNMIDLLCEIISDLFYPSYKVFKEAWKDIQMTIQNIKDIVSIWLRS